MTQGSMKNIRSIFTALEHSELGSNENKLEILLRADKITFSKTVSYVYHKDSLSVLEEQLDEDTDYYVIDDFRVYKGKQIVKSGEIVISKKAAILDFVQRNYYVDGRLKEDDVYPIQILSRSSPTFVITMGHDCENYLVLFTEAEQ